MFQPEPHIRIRCEMENHAATGRGFGQVLNVKVVSSNQVKTRMLFRPMEKLSQPITSQSSRNRRSQRLLPIKPTAPITKTLSIRKPHAKTQRLPAQTKEDGPAD